jgi:hypothetical protein
MRKIKYAVEIVSQDGKNITLRFECDGFAFGTEETLDEITMPIEELLEELQKIDEKKWEEGKHE